jgi:hypothetical protein
VWSSFPNAVAPATSAKKIHSTILVEVESRICLSRPMVGR